jgi:hypothetical protein
MTARPGLTGSLDALANAPLPELAPPPEKVVKEVKPAPKSRAKTPAKPKATEGGKAEPSLKQAPAPAAPEPEVSVFGPPPTKLPSKVRHQYKALPEQVEQLQRITAFLQARGYQMYTGDVIARAVAMFETHVVEELNGGRPLPERLGSDDLVRGHFS